MPDKKHVDLTPSHDSQAVGHSDRAVANNPSKRGIAWPAVSALRQPEADVAQRAATAGVAQRTLRAGVAQRIEPLAQQAASVVQRTINKTGMPDRLKAGLESLSGMDLSPVRVHFNSAKPAQLNALAYAQGESIHLAPGQERHLPHEAWHVVQQKQGRVSPTIQVNGQAVNNDRSLEAEADHMGSRAIQMVAAPGQAGQLVSFPVESVVPAQAVVQRLTLTDASGGKTAWYKSMFKLRYGQADHFSGAHNYAFEEGKEANWAKSASNRHAEVKLLHFVSQEKDAEIGLVSELSPCDGCEADLSEFEREHDVSITVHHFTGYEDTGGATNKANIQAFYKSKRYINYTRDIAPYLTDAGNQVLGLNEEESSSGTSDNEEAAVSSSSGDEDKDMT